MLNTVSQKMERMEMAKIKEFANSLIVNLFIGILIAFAWFVRAVDWMVNVGERCRHVKERGH